MTDERVCAMVLESEFAGWRSAGATDARKWMSGTGVEGEACLEGSVKRMCCRGTCVLL